MQKPPYAYKKEFLTRYTFLSYGRRSIERIVEFTPLSVKNLYNLGFGNLLPGGKVDDEVRSNNGDIIRVLSTVIHIIKDFTEERPEAKVIFTGSTTLRTALYQRILKTYFSSFSEGYIITALKEISGKPIETPFDPDSKEQYLAFFIKRKNYNFE